jgi:hypothetical protein
VGGGGAGGLGWGAGGDGGGGGGGDDEPTTVNVPFIELGCGSHRYEYVPAANESVQVTMPIEATSVFWSTPGPWRWKLWLAALSSTWIVNVPADS